MKITDPLRLLFLLVGFAKTCNAKENIYVVEQAYEQLLKRPEAMSVELRKDLEDRLKQYCFDFNKDQTNNQNAFQERYVQWCYYCVKEAHSYLHGYSGADLDNDEVDYVCGQLLKLARHPMVHRVAARGVIELFFDFNIPAISQAAQRSIALIDKSVANLHLVVLSPAELRQRLAPISANLHEIPARVEAVDDNKMLLVYQHPNPRHGLVEREFPKGEVFKDVRVGQQVLLEIQTDADQKVISYNPVMAADEQDEGYGLKPPEPPQDLYNEQGERNEKASAAYQSAVDEWMDEKMRCRDLQTEPDWLKSF